MDADNKPIDPVADANTQRDEMIERMNNTMDNVLQRITQDEFQSGWQRYVASLLKRIRKRAGIAQLTPRHMAVINAVLTNDRGKSDAPNT
jgi:hypothetical protein